MAKYKSRAKRCVEAADKLTRAGEKCQEVLDLLDDEGQRREKWPAAKVLLDEVDALAEDGKAELEELKEEMESWRDSIPENLQGGSKYEEVSSAAEGLESAIHALIEELPDIELDPESEGFADAAQEIVDALSTIADELDDAAGQANDVEFPGMMG